MALAPVALACGLLAAGCARGEAHAIPTGEQLYAACESCHGARGEGNVELSAPKLAGLPAWYLTRQLQRFKDGTRGAHPDDEKGLRMRAMARQMMSDAEVEAVVTYVAAMPDVDVILTLPEPDLNAGQADFAACAVCHGEKGEGNESIMAPRIAGLNDWYVAAQIRKYRTGIRGGAEGDDVGAAMREMANKAVAPERINNLAAYIQRLPG
ncbi:MAG: c-type cytochrome [Acidobacteria bacterium]|nr:c-type cytochrome [Acidobacteriota bacterium]